MRGQSLFTGIVVSCVVACGGDPGRVPGTASFLAGPKSFDAGFTIAPPGPVPHAGPGRYLVTPDQVEVTLTSIAFNGSSNDMQPVNDCAVTYDARSASLASLSECDVEIKEGAYDMLVLNFEPAYQVLIDSPALGIYSDPASPTGLTSTLPAGGAQSIEVRPGGGLNAIVHFVSPFQVEADTPLEISVVLHALHKITVDVDASGTPRISNDNGPLEMSPSVTGVASVEFYSSTGTGADVGPTTTEAAEMFVFSDTEGPTLVGITHTGGLEPCNQGIGYANNANPANSPVGRDGNRAGGYLGLGGGSTYCWAFPQDSAFTSYTGIYAVDRVTAPGGSTAIACQSSTTAPAPTSGDTYASGCPTITPSATVSVQLVGQ